MDARIGACFEFQGSKQSAEHPINLLLLHIENNVSNGMSLKICTKIGMVNFIKKVPVSIGKTFVSKTHVVNDPSE